MQRIYTLVLLLVLCLSLIGCTATQKGAVLGALGGGAAGAAIGYWGHHNSTDYAVKGTAIGVLSGAIIGGIIGYCIEE